MKNPDETLAKRSPQSDDEEGVRDPNRHQRNGGFQRNRRLRSHDQRQGMAQDEESRG